MKSMLRRLPLNPVHKRYQALPSLVAANPDSLLCALSRVVVPPVHQPGACPATHLHYRRESASSSPVSQLVPQTAGAI